MNKFLLKITEKWPAKVLSVAAALILSIFYRMNTLEIRTFTVPLQIETSNIMIPASSLPSTVRVNLQGESNSIYPILEEDIVAYIDLDRYTSEGMHRIPVKIRKKGSALGIEPLEVSVAPIEIPLLLEQMVRRDIPIKPVFRGTIARDHELIYQSIIPESVYVEGPKSALDRLYEFNTETIDLDGRYDDFNVLVRIINTNPLIIIHGNRMAEYNGNIRRIPRTWQVFTGENEE